ncbi:MAG TPA: S9 family peptidase [Gemmatimonadales bacterium]|nr:S9 family peptidase [Gemmatimonadales bacterium]
MPRPFPSLLLVSLVLAAPRPAPAQTADSALLTVRRIYASHDFDPERFGPARWLAGGAAYTTLEPSPDLPGGRDLVRYDVATGARTLLVPARRLIPAGDTVPLPVDDYRWSDDERKLLVFTNSKRVWRTNTRGDYWALDLATWRLRKLGGPRAAPSTLMFAKFSPDGTRVGYVREHDLYVEDLATGRITRLTRDGSTTIINGTTDWVYEEELKLRDAWRWSPDGHWIAFWRFDASGVRDFDLIDNTDSLYSQVIPIQYPKAGGQNSAVRVGVVAATGGPVRWLALPGDPRNNYTARMEWAAGSEELLVERLNRLQNTNTLYLASRHTGSVHPVLVERDSTWVQLVNQIPWLDGGKSFLWQSERDGWMHLYRVSRDGGSVRLLTPGEFDVASVAGVDTTRGWVYYVASPGAPTRRYLWRARLDGSGTAERLSPADQPGTHDYDLAPDATVAFHTWSRFGVPPVTDLVRLPGHEVVRTVVANTTLRDRVAALSQGPVEFFQVDVGDGVRLNGWIMKPADFDPARRYPILFTVYGGPGSQTVLDSWGGTTWLWHLMLTQHGYLVASVDNRGTGMRGHDWKRIVYRRLGVIETRDQAAAARAIARWPWVDSSRVGIWGWSYGGFMSLNCLFQAPDVYSMGIAVAPVTHWKFYDDVYTERYNGLPQDNKEGYDTGSPLSHVDGLRGRLLLVHGTGDDNVHYQNSEALINALVAADKPFEFMSYPNRTHGIFGGNTTVHLRQLLTRFVDQTLGPPRALPHRPPGELTN